MAIEAGLARALDDAPDSFMTFSGGGSFQISAGEVVDQATRVAAAEGPAAARELVLGEIRRYRRWLRAVGFGLATGDGNLAAGLRDTIAYLSPVAIKYGLHSGAPLAQFADELIAIAALQPSEDWGLTIAELLASHYRRQGRPELALSILVRSPSAVPADAAPRYLLDVLDSARRTYAKGKVSRVSELLALDGWRTDPTGLVRELLRRLATGVEPAPAELAARQLLRQDAMKRGDWAALRELALSDVMWLEDNPTLWQALSAILKMNGADQQAVLAASAADLVASR